MGGWFRRQVNDAGVDLVKRFEGLSLKAYRCPAGVWTIGYGHTDGVRPDDVCTEKQALDWLREDLAIAGAAVDDLITVPLTDNQFAALCSFTMNLGAGALRRSQLRKQLNRGAYQAVPAELAKWVKARDPRTGQKNVLNGLVRRRAAEAELWQA